MHGMRQDGAAPLPAVLGTGTCIHAVPGRLRLRIPRLKASPWMAAALEHELRRVEGVLRVEANALTGNLLIVYDKSSQTADDLFAIAVGADSRPDPSPRDRPEARPLVRERVVDAVVRSTVEAAVTSLIRSFML
jgi:hypothetical protein